jgi:phosphoribosylformylglycinamidine synthase
MIQRIEIFSKVRDTRAVVKKGKISAINAHVHDVIIVDVYTITKSLNDEQIKIVAQQLTNPLTQTYTRTKNKWTKDDFSYAIEIGYLPGVTDNIATTVKEIITDVLKTPFEAQENVYTSQITFLFGTLSEKDALEIASSLYNPLIQRMHLKSFSAYQNDGGMDAIVPEVKVIEPLAVSLVDLDVSDEALITIGKSGIANSDDTRRGPLALDLTYMKTIQQYFENLGRKPTDIELESIAQTWSEHCKHTIFADPLDEVKEGLFKTYIKRATDEIRKKSKKDICVSVFTDNSGAIAFDDEYLVTHKVETHNSPSALDPFGGAITGIVGVNRDAMGFGLGAKPVANFYGYCFADPRIDKPLYKDAKKQQKMLSSKRIMDGVIDGVNAGGNQSGIPTPQGFIYFDERFRGKPLVFVGTVGLIPRKIKGQFSHIKKANVGDYIVVVGGRVGKDGIHGATFSSEALGSGSPATAVQIGDPITQKKMSDALIKEARDQLLYTSITDNGAGGLSCSVAEMAKETNGCLVELDNVPLKYPGLASWEIWISESQERMTLSVSPEKWEKFSSLMQRRGVEATVIGTFTDSGSCIVKYGGKTIVDIDLAFLHDGLPQRVMKTKQPKPNEVSLQLTSEPYKPSSNQTKSLLSMLRRLNITSFEFTSQQYDHIVQGNAVLGPLQGRGRVNADASVFRPVLSSQKGVVMAQALYPAYSELDPYNMAACSVDTAIRNAVALGANPTTLALLDNFCWCSSTDPQRLWQLKQAAQACYDYAIAYQTPYVSGKDSMFNDFKGYDASGNPIAISIPPTLLISSFGVIEAITDVVSLDAKMPGDLIYLLGETHDELAGSEYFQMVQEEGTFVPKVETTKTKPLYNALHQAIQHHFVASSISIGRGGLAVALAKKAIGGQLGITLSLEKMKGTVARDDFALFSESQGRLLVTVAKANKKTFEAMMKDISYAKIGVVTKKRNIIVTGREGNEIIKSTVDEATHAYRDTFKNY